MVETTKNYQTRHHQPVLLFNPTTKNLRDKQPQDKPVDAESTWKMRGNTPPISIPRELTCINSATTTTNNTTVITSSKIIEGPQVQFNQQNHHRSTKSISTEETKIQEEADVVVDLDEANRQMKWKMGAANELMVQLSPRTPRTPHTPMTPQPSSTNFGLFDHLTASLSPASSSSTQFPTASSSTCVLSRRVSLPAGLGRRRSSTTTLTHLHQLQQLLSTSQMNQPQPKPHQQESETLMSARRSSTVSPVSAAANNDKSERSNKVKEKQ